MGPGLERIDSRAGVIRTRAGGEWTGAWHSLAGLAGESQRLFDPTDVTGLGGSKEVRAEVTGVTVDASGVGELRVELADEKKMVRWSRTMRLDPGGRTRYRFDVDAQELGAVKFLNWVAESGCAVEVSSVGFEVERPVMSDEEWLLRVSLGKLRRCHDAVSGLTRDRAHLPAGVFDSVTSAGLHALASAAAAQEEILDRETVVREVRRTARAFMEMPKAAGFLPHFTRRNGAGQAELHPGTEYSTVDSAIALISLRLAGEILELKDVSDAVASMIGDLDFDLVSDPEGWIGHGFSDDGTTPLAAQWRDWGGETALVLMLEAMVPDREPRGRMESGGRVFRGVEFIAEIQSLLFPDFDTDRPDLLTGTDWRHARRDLLQRQRVYFQKNWPDSEAARAGLFGLSGGEAGMPGDGYTAAGVQVPGIRWLHPHAMVMGLALSDRDSFADGIRCIDDAGLLFPFGLPENIEVGLARHNPMLGSLNAGFESLSAYHGWRRGKGDVIDAAGRADPLLRDGVRRLWAD